MATLLTPADISPLMADGIRRLRKKRPEFHPFFRKRLAQHIGMSYGYADRIAAGNLDRVDSSLLLNVDQFFDGLLLPEIRGMELSDEALTELLETLQKAERIAKRWTLT